MKLKNLLLVVLALPLAVACSAPKKRTADTPEAREAADIFATRCTPCHGAGGHGDGTASASLNPKPRNYTDKAWQKSVTDEHIEKVIVYGGAAVGKSPAMPANPDLQSKPLVVSALKDKVRSFGQ